MLLNILARPLARSSTTTSLLTRSIIRPSVAYFSTSNRMAIEIKTLTVFGAGLMGAGIVQVAAQNGLKVIMTDVSEEALANGRAIITKSLTRIAKKLHPDSEALQKSVLSSTFANITTTTDAATAVASTDLIIEAIVENLSIKQSLFRRLDELAPAHTVFTTNTSSLSIASIASTSSLERQSRFAGFHAFNPVPQMKLVEVVQTESCSDETRDALVELCKKMKKTPVQCKDTPGFIVNRLLVPYMLSALRMVERGEATAADIDTAMKLGAGMPMGPFELSDFVGLDTLSSIAKGWREDRVGEVEASDVAEVAILEKLLGEGKKGRKSGEGFYKY